MKFTNSPSWEFQLDSDRFEGRNITVRFRTSDGKNYSDVLSLNLIIGPEDGGDGGPLSDPALTVTGAATVSLVGLAGLAYLREDIRFALFSLLTAPLYTKLERDELLDHPHRQDIYAYLTRNPGANLSTIRRESGLGYGTVVHHLNVLEKENYIRSKKGYRAKIVLC